MTRGIEKWKHNLCWLSLKQRMYYGFMRYSIREYVPKPIARNFGTWLIKKR